MKSGGKIVIKEGNRDPQPGASYDQQIVWDLFSNCIDASCRTRGKFEVDIAWKNCTLVETTISSTKGGQALVHTNGKIQTIHLVPNEAITIKP